VRTVTDAQVPLIAGALGRIAHREDRE